MGMLNRVGTMVLSPTENYIIGASDKENAAFQKKCENIINIKEETLKNGVRLDNTPVINKIVYSSDNYNNFNKVTGMPNSCFGDNYGREIQASIQTIVSAYCEGRLSEEELEKAFIDTCKDMRVYHAQMGHTTGTNKEDNTQIIEDVYEMFQKYNVRSTVNNCYKEGESIAKEYGGSGKNNWVYYNSDYYYQSQHLRDILQKSSQKAASHWELEGIDFDRVQKGSKLTLDGGLDFNSVWNFRASNTGVSSLMDADWKPDENFSLFYQENVYKGQKPNSTLASQKGICIIQYGTLEWNIDVPFNNSTVLGKVEEYFNAGELFSLTVNHTATSDLLTYLGKFELYTRFYGHKKDFI